MPSVLREGSIHLFVGFAVFRFGDTDAVRFGWAAFCVDELRGHHGSLGHAFALHRISTALSELCDIAC